jgi:hypothetical protein
MEAKARDTVADRLNRAVDALDLADVRVADAATLKLAVAVVVVAVP